MDNFTDCFCPYCNTEYEPDNFEPDEVDSDGIYGNGSALCTSCEKEFDYSFEQLIVVQTYKKEDND